LQSLIEGYNEHDLDERVSGKSHDMTMTSLCEQYQEALGRKDLAFVLGLFTDDAVIRAPVSGAANVKDFHAYIFSNTKRTAMRFPNVIRRRDAPAAITMQFSYTLAIEGGHIVVLDGVANFEIDERAMKIKSLTFVYDPAEVRQLMAEAGIAPPDHPEPAFAQHAR